MMQSVEQKRKVTYRLYPTPRQSEALGALLRSHQTLYNAALEERIGAWRIARKSISYADQCASLTEIRRDMPEWAEANCSSQQMTLRRLDKAFAAFLPSGSGRRVAGFPALQIAVPLSRFLVQVAWRRLALHARQRRETWLAAHLRRRAYQVPRASPTERQGVRFGPAAPGWSMVFVPDRAAGEDRA